MKCREIGKEDSGSPNSDRSGHYIDGMQAFNYSYSAFNKI